MGKVLTAIAAMMACVSATASAQVHAPVNPMPPPEYRGTGAVIVVFVPEYLLEQVCGIKAPEGLRLRACARMFPGGKKYVVMPDPCAYAEQEYALIMCHENGHALGGWPGDHPQ